MTDTFRDFCDVMQAHAVAERRKLGLSSVCLVMVALETSNAIAASGLRTVTNSALVACGIQEAELEPRLRAAADGLRDRQFRIIERPRA